MNTKYLDKVLKNHLPYCKMHEFSLQTNRHCSCGVEKARNELFILKRSFGLIEKIDEWLESHDSLSSNSFAHMDIDALLEMAKKA